MTVKAMTPSQQQRFIRICEDQGIRVTRTKKGLFLRFPDGSSTVQHFTQSDVKANQNQIARFRRAGMTHPDDPRGPVKLPAYITSGTISAATRKKIVDFVVGADFPEVVYQKDVTRALNMDPGWANRALYHTGFRAGKAKNAKIGRPWYTPQDILELKDQVDGATDSLSPNGQYQNPGKTIGEAATPEFLAEHATPPIGEPDPEVVEALDAIEDDEAHPTPPTPEQFAKALDDGTAEDIPLPITIDEAMNPTRDEPEVNRLKALGQESIVQRDGDREFIDSHDSWVVEPQELFGDKFERFLRDELRVIKALGLEFEIRVWRKP